MYLSSFPILYCPPFLPLLQISSLHLFIPSLPLLLSLFSSHRLPSSRFLPLGAVLPSLPEVCHHQITVQMLASGAAFFSCCINISHYSLIYPDPERITSMPSLTLPPCLAFQVLYLTLRHNPPSPVLHSVTPSNPPSPRLTLRHPV